MQENLVGRKYGYFISKEEKEYFKEMEQLNLDANRKPISSHMPSPPSVQSAPVLNDFDKNFQLLAPANASLKVTPKVKVRAKVLNCEKWSNKPRYEGGSRWTDQSIHQWRQDVV
jgi:hypothetical protein